MDGEGKTADGEAKNAGWRRWRRWFAELETATKAIGVAIAAIAILSFVIPPLGTLVNVITAWRFGAVGYARYEVAPKESSRGGNYLTPRGQFWLLSSDPGDDYQDLRIGDRLQAASPINFREDKDSDARIIFVLDKGDCVIVLGADDPVESEGARSGGWLKVATTACGLFG